MTKPKVDVVPLTALQSDPQNANKGTERGLRVLDDSLRELGAGRSVLTDRRGVLIAGNKTHERAVDLGYQEAVIVHTDGRQLVVVQRDDLDLETDPRAKRLAIVDNRAGEVGLDWDAGVLAALQEEDADLLKGLWTDGELERLLGEVVTDPMAEWQGMPEFKQEDLSAYQSITVHFAEAGDVRAFAELIDQQLTDKTKSIWYPKRDYEPLKALAYHDES